MKERIVSLYDLFSLTDWLKLNTIAFGFYFIVQLLLIVKLLIYGRGQRLLAFRLKATFLWLILKFVLTDFLFIGVSNLFGSAWFMLLGFSWVYKILSSIGFVVFILVINYLK